MNADGSGFTRLTRNRTWTDDEPSYSPDGSQIVFTRQLGQTKSTLFVVAADGSVLRQLTPPGFNAGDPDWSPDGTQIVFAQVPRGGGDDPQDLFTIEPDGSSLTKITHNAPGRHSFDPHWSPDGTQIVFARERFDDGLGIFTMNADGSGGAKLTTGIQYDWDPDWGSALSKMIPA
jgi:Tol biopolymer transport system component